ncbi:hypothetical protein EV421DRAFT_1820043 [Armillaria borealis]|uniref:DUF6534 domain-containing protein n=1 Tax=Armillaria borealis TaxID=47425 RepID=A0AA39MMS2_9AGAR|nr:hypothetical protein EV421DRAFT_1820043 [Armillaria borealis]
MHLLSTSAWVILWLVATCVADILITVILVWHLYGNLKNHKTGFRGSDESVDRIIQSTVQTGLITTLCALIDLLTYLLDVSLLSSPQEHNGLRGRIIAHRTPSSVQLPSPKAIYQHSSEQP